MDQIQFPDSWVHSFGKACVVLLLSFLNLLFALNEVQGRIGSLKLVHNGSRKQIGSL